MSKFYQSCKGFISIFEWSSSTTSSSKMKLAYPLFLSLLLSLFFSLSFSLSRTFFLSRIGNASTSIESSLGKLLAPLFQSPDTFFVISSDFCHWGERFQFNAFDKAKGEKIHEFISWLDNVGMGHISMQDPGAFAQYLKETRNTICGRHPIAVFLHMVVESRSKKRVEIKFLVSSTSPIPQFLLSFIIIVILYCYFILSPY
jgi:hypothetical protein